MSDPLPPTPDEIADSAVAAASEAFDSVKAFTTGIASDRIHAASLLLHEAGSASTVGPSDEETWIRQAAMMLLVGVQAVSDDERSAVDDDVDEYDYDVRIEEAWRLLAQGRLAEAEALAACSWSAQTRSTPKTQEIWFTTGTSSKAMPAFAEAT